MNQTTSPYLIVKNSIIHNHGVFAKKNIPNGTRLLEYVGEKISKKEADRRSDRTIRDTKNNPEKGAVYVFELDKQCDIDGNVPWNTARLINHSCNPNCEAVIEGGRIWIDTIRDIRVGEELHYNYGYDIEGFQEHPCRCGSSRCVGYIVDEEHWPKLNKRLAQLRAG